MNTERPKWNQEGDLSIPTPTTHIKKVSDDLRNSLESRFKTHLRVVESEQLSCEQYLLLMQNGLVRAKELLQRPGEMTPAQDFNVRGLLYDLASQVAPDARISELNELITRMRIRESSRVIDLMSGTGFVSRRVARITQSGVWAVDSSYVQLALQLLRTEPPYPYPHDIWPIKVDLSSPDIFVLWHKSEAGM